jgi:hypothetical protein
MKPTYKTSEVSVSKMPSIFSNADSIPKKFEDRTREVRVAVDDKFLVNKGFADGFDLPKEEVKKILKASPINVDSNEAVDVDEDYGDDAFGSDDKPPNTKVLERLRNPPFNNSTDEAGVDVLSDPNVISHVDEIYSKLKTGVKIVKNKGGRGAGGGRGVEMTFEGKKLSELKAEDLPALEKALSVLKKAGDNATGRVARRIVADYKKLSGYERGIKTGKKSASQMADELKEQLQANTEEAKDMAEAGLKSALKKAKSEKPKSVSVEELIKAEEDAQAEPEDDEDQAGDGDGGAEDEEDDRETTATDPRAVRKTKAVKNWGATEVKYITKEWFISRDVRTDIAPMAKMFGVEVPTIPLEPAERAKMRKALIKSILAKKVELIKKGQLVVERPKFLTLKQRRDNKAGGGGGEKA